MDGSRRCQSETRFALVLNGGVSLATGGAAPSHERDRPTPAGRALRAPQSEK
jgi:hypothetical protein